MIVHAAAVQPFTDRESTMNHAIYRAFELYSVAPVIIATVAFATRQLLRTLSR